MEEYRKEAEAMLRDTPAACREAAEVTRTTKTASTIERVLQEHDRHVVGNHS